MTTPIYGVRLWRLYHGDSCLYPLMVSSFDGSPWSGPVCVSRNGVDDKQRGFWSVRPHYFNALLTLAKYGEFEAMGVIEHRGTIMEYDKGWRSDRAVVRFLQVTGPISDNIREAYATRYECDVDTLSGYALWKVHALFRCRRWLSRQRRFDLTRARSAI